MSHDSHMTLKKQWYQAGNIADLRERPGGGGGGRLLVI